MSEKPTYKKGQDNTAFYKACQENMLKGAIKNLLPSVPKEAESSPISLKDLLKESVRASVKIPKAVYDSVKTYNELGDVARNAPKGYERNDKYAHALLSCVPSQTGVFGRNYIKAVGDFEEWRQIKMGENTPESSAEDSTANAVGRMLGYDNPTGSCHDMVSEIYPMYIKNS